MPAKRKIGSSDGPSDTFHMTMRKRRARAEEPSAPQPPPPKSPRHSASLRSSRVPSRRSSVPASLGAGDPPPPPSPMPALIPSSTNSPPSASAVPSASLGSAPSSIRGGLKPSRGRGGGRTPATRKPKPTLGKGRFKKKKAPKVPFFGAAKEKALSMAEAAINSSTGESPFPKTWSGPELDALEARMKGLNEAYQGIGGTLKPAMHARAKRSIAKLEVDPNYLESIEYAGLEAALKGRLEERKKVLEAKLKLELDQAERIREGEEILIERQYREELEGIRDDYLSHGKLAMMRRVRRYERAEDGPDNDKLLIRVKNDRNALKPRGQGEDRGPVYYEIDAIWDDWHTRMADARVQGLSSMPLPRPYAQIPRL